MRKVYTTPDHFTMLLLKFFNLLLIFLSRPYVARNRCRFVGLLEGDFWISACFGWVVGELVVHSTEWTTGSELFLAFGLVSAFSRELVVHSMEWTTGSELFLAFGPFSAVSRELVVHSTEWTTGSGLPPSFWSVFDGFLES